MELSEWTTQVINLLRHGNDSKAYNVKALLALLAPSSEYGIASLTTIRSSSDLSSLQYLISNTLGLPPDDSTTSSWKDLIANHVLYLANKERREGVEKVFESFNQSYMAFTRIYKKIPEGKWSAPVVGWFCNKLHELAKEADGNFKHTGRKPTHYNEAVRSIQQQFSACQVSTEKFPLSKLYGVLYCMNALFKIFFKLDKIQACETLMKWYQQNQGNISLKAYPMSVQVTFNYFAGRMSLYCMNEERALEALEFAGKHCNMQANKNKALIIRYLIPLSLSRGMYPSEAFLAKYGLNEYVEISKAIRTGNVYKFNQELSNYEELYIAKGVYLIMDKLRYMTYRNLFMKTLQIVNPPSRQMQLEDFRRALEFSCREPVDLLEIELLLSNMISSKCLLGYINHEKAIIVMTKSKEAFPPVINSHPW